MGCNRVVYQVRRPSYGDGRIFPDHLSRQDDRVESTSVLFLNLHSPMGTGRCTFGYAFRKTCSRELFYFLEKIPETFTKTFTFRVDVEHCFNDFRKMLVRL